MVELPDALAQDIEKHFEPHLQIHDSDYLCTYGSSVYGNLDSRSDVDLFLVTHDGPFEIDGLVQFVTRLHEAHGRRVDVEVPYENKVHYTGEEIDTALALGGFIFCDEGIVVPDVEKNQEFLGSEAIKARLALNALTTPHVVFGNNLERYHKIRIQAEEAVVLLSTQLSGRNEFSISDLYDALVRGPSGQTGEMYLGYKTEYPIVATHLQTLLGDGTERLQEKAILERSDDALRVAAGFDLESYLSSIEARTGN